MSYPVQNYHANNGSVADSFTSANQGDMFNSLFGMANQMMNEMVRTGGAGGSGGMSSFSMTDPNNPHVKVFGVSSMNITQLSRGPDGRPHIIQAHDERRMGPGGVWQTKKALRDPDRGIDKMQVGYFVGEHGEIVERQLDPSTGKYRQEVKRRGVPPNDTNFSQHWRGQAQQAMERPRPPPSPPAPQQQHYNQQQHSSPYSQHVPPHQQHYNQQQHPSPYSQHAPPYPQQPQHALPPPPNSYYHYQ